MQSKPNWITDALPAYSILAIFFAVAGCASLAETSQGAYATSVQRALEYLPDDESLDWVDPETEVPSRVTVLNTVETADGAYCRDLVFEVIPVAIEERAEAAEPGVAPEGADLDASKTYCRDVETGSWEVEEVTTS